MNKTLLYLLFLLLGGIVLGSSLAFLTSINNQKLLTAALYNPPSCPFHIGLTPYSINNDKDFEEAVLLKAFFNYAVIDKNNTPICNESDNLNTCLARFQNFCYSQGKCDEKYDPSKGAATITPQIQSYLCTLWTQRHTKLFDSWAKVTSLFKLKNIPLPNWLTTSCTNYLTWENQQNTTTTKSNNQTTTTTILLSSSNLNITFPKVSQPTLFVYPDPNIIKSIVSEGYDYSPRIETLLKQQGENAYFNTIGPYGEIVFGQSRQFQAAIVYPDGKYITSLDDPERFVFEENRENIEKEKYYMPPLSECIVKVNYQVKENSKPNIISWVYEQIIPGKKISEHHDDIVALDLVNIAKKIWNLPNPESGMMTQELDDKLKFLPALSYFQEVTIPAHYYRWESVNYPKDKEAIMSYLHYIKTQKDGEIIWKLTDPKIIKDSQFGGHPEFDVEKGICDVTPDQMASLNEWFKKEYPYLDISLETKLGFKNEIKDSEIKLISPAESGGKVTNSGLVIAPLKEPNRGVIFLDANGEIYNLPYLNRPYLYLKVADKKQEAKSKTIRIEFLDSRFLTGKIRPAGIPSNITGDNLTVCDEDNKSMIWLESLSGQEDIILIFTQNKIIQDPSTNWLYFNFSGDKEDEAVLEGIHLWNPNLWRSKITYKYFPDCGYKITLGKICFNDNKCNENEQCIRGSGIVKYCTDVLKNPHLQECPSGYDLVKPSQIYPNTGMSHRAYCCSHSSLRQKGGTGCDAGNWVYPAEACNEAPYSPE